MKSRSLALLMVAVIVVLILVNDPAARPPLKWPSTAPAGAASGSGSGSGSGSAGITGKPTISAAFINQVLAAAGSPAEGTGAALYADGVQWGIDPAYALAFFKHESSFGTTGVARYTRSLGNIRCTSGYTCLYGFRAYGSWQAGYANWFSMMHTLYIQEWHLTTLQQIIPVYAPSSDHNDPQAYIASVQDDVTRWQAGKL